MWKYLPTQLIIFTEVRDLQHLVNQLKLKIEDDGTTMIHNDGQVIKISKEENDGIEINGKKCSVYNHELVFGHLRSSSNYDDTVVRQTSGKNGLGVKCTNILSKSLKL